MFLFLIFLDTVCANAFAEEFLTKDDPKGSWAEKILLKDLLHDYEKKARPVVDGVSPVVKFSETHNVQQVTIEFGLSLIQILDLNENEQILTTSVRTLYRWKDYHLVWDPAEYENITYVNIPTAKLWLPDIALYNHADERVSEIRVCDAQVDYKGTVQWQPRAIYKSACQVHIKYFPFDQQNCKMKFGPWTYDGARTNISFYNDFDALDLSDYEPSPEWDLVTTKAVYTATRYPCCPHIYPDITFSVVIKRQPAFYNYVIILPCFLLSSLTLVLFCLPPETPAKMQLGMNMFQAFNFLLLILTQSIPSAASSFPLIGTYYCINMLLVTLSTFLCLIVVNCHFRGDSQSEVPQWIKTIIIVYGARFLFVNVHSRPTKTRGEETTTKKLSNKLASEANSALAEAAHADRLMRSAGYRAPGLSGIRARDSLRSAGSVVYDGSMGPSSSPEKLRRGPHGTLNQLHVQELRYL
nr:unnamed protein product [Spirometra erinaceieuropaei]